MAQFAGVPLDLGAMTGGSGTDGYSIADMSDLLNIATGRDSRAKGVHSCFPMATAKSARWIQGRHHENEDTMARMFIKVPPKTYEKFIASLSDPDTQMIARYLTGDDVKQGGTGYLDFFLAAANHQFSEKYQVTEVLSDNYVAFFFGHAAPIFQYQGYLMNTYQDDWTMRMFRIFRDLGRGTQLAKRGQLLRLRYDSMIVSGAMTDFRWTLTAGQETYCEFSFGLLVKSVSIIYGGLTTPTKVSDSFAPEGFVLEDTSGGPSRTYVGGASDAAPAGVSAPSVPEPGVPVNPLDPDPGQKWQPTDSTTAKPQPPTVTGQSSIFNDDAAAAAQAKSDKAKAFFSDGKR